MNILIVCPRLCHGGAERVAVCLANGFVDRGHHVRFMADLFEEQTYTLDNRVKLVNLISTNDSKIKKWGGALKNVRKESKKVKPDVIIGIMDLCSLVSRLATLGLCVPVVTTVHSAFDRRDSKPLPWTDTFSRYYINRIYDYVTVLTMADKKVIGKRLKNVAVMPNPLAINPIKNVPCKEKIILAAGRVDNWHVKGFDVLIKAWGKVCKDNVNDSFKDWKLQIAGVWRKNSTKQYLNDIAKESGVENRIEFLGFVEDMQSQYQKSSVFVLSSRYEGFGLVLIEAMSQGCAPIACDFKGRQREILNPSSALPEGEGEPNRKIEITENGILCEPENVDALASAMKKMIEDNEYRNKVQKNAIEQSRFYDTEHTMNRWEKYLESIIKK